MQKTHASPSFASPTWPTALIALHWITVLLVVTLFALVISREFAEDNAIRETLLQWHRHGGLTAFWLVLVRITLRLGAAVPYHDLPPAVRVASRAGHGLMYVALLALPLAGYFLMCARTGHVDYFGIHLPSLIERDRDLADTLEAVHSWMGWTLLGLVGLHAAVALWHHHVLKDNVLRSMLPAGRRAA
ncbi:MAG: cytochrome b [Acidobacteriota bacterium]